MFPRSLRNLARHKKVFVSLSVKVTFPTRWEWWTLKGVSERLNDWKALQAVPIRKNTHHLSSSHVVSVGLHFMILLIKNELLECQHSVSSNTHTHTRAVAFILQAWWSFTAGELCWVVHQLFPEASTLISIIDMNVNLLSFKVYPKTRDEYW